MLIADHLFALIVTHITMFAQTTKKATKKKNKLKIAASSPFSSCLQNSQKITKAWKMPADVLVVLIRTYRLVVLLCRRSRMGTNHTAGQASQINSMTWSPDLRQPIRMKQIRGALWGDKIYTDSDRGKVAACNSLFTNRKKRQKRPTSVKFHLISMGWFNQLPASAVFTEWNQVNMAAYTAKWNKFTTKQCFEKMIINISIITDISSIASLLLSYSLMYAALAELSNCIMLIGGYWLLVFVRHVEHVWFGCTLTDPDCKWKWVLPLVCEWFGLYKHFHTIYTAKKF